MDQGQTIIGVGETDASGTDGATPPTAEKRDWRAAPDAVWEAVRMDYLSGTPAPEVARRHGVSVSALRNRASTDGWRRADQPWTPAHSLDPDDEGIRLEQSVEGCVDEIEMRQLSYVACCRMMRAVLRGDAAGALHWRRVRDAMNAEQATQDRWDAEAEAFDAAMESKAKEAAAVKAKAKAKAKVG